MKRLYVIGRADLAPGLRAAQAAHALAALGLEHHRDFKRWDNSYLILLEARDLASLESFYARARKQVTTSEWREPDLGMELTAIAIAPSETAQLLCSEFPLMHSAMPRRRGFRRPRLHSLRRPIGRTPVSKTGDEGSSPSALTNAPEEVV